MNETEYIRAMNRVKVSAAITILQDVLAADDYGVTKQDMGNILGDLYLVEKNLFASYSLDEGQLQ